MSRTNYVDKEGNTVLSIHLWEYDVVDCAMCEKETTHRYAVPWYCGPVEEGENEGGYKCVCKECYEKWVKKYTLPKVQFNQTGGTRCHTKKLI